MIFVPYLVLSSLILGMNVIPAFMPPTWTVLALYHIKYRLPILPLVLIGALSATCGRIILAYLSQTVFRRFLPLKNKQNYENMGRFLKSKSHITIPVIVGYAFLPIPSNQVFIAAGLAKFDIRLLSLSFFFGRIVSYSFWVSVASRISDNIEGIFAGHYSRIGSFIVEAIGFILLYFLGQIGWKKLLKHQKLS